MKLYLDVHEIPGVKAADVAKAHEADVAVQGKHNVEYIKYWLNEESGKIYCLCRAADQDSANAAHREAHGLVASRMIEVDQDIVDSMLGTAEVLQTGVVVKPNSKELDPGFRTIMFTDICNSTELTQRLGDSASMDLIERHDNILISIITKFKGQMVKHTGDGIMSSFIDPIQAMNCAAGIQSEVKREFPTSADYHIKLRIGAAAGEPVERKGDFFGSTVQLAHRLCEHASPEEILVSDSLVSYCDGKVPFQLVGDLSLKGFSEPVKAHKLVWA